MKLIKKLHYMYIFFNKKVHSWLTPEARWCDYIPRHMYTENYLWTKINFGVQQTANQIKWFIPTVKKSLITFFNKVWYEASIISEP